MHGLEAYGPSLTATYMFCKACGKRIDLRAIHDPDITDAEAMVLRKSMHLPGCSLMVD